MNDALIPGHPYARIATAETVAAVTRDDVIELKNRLMTRDRLMVVVVGDITAEELKPKLDEVFGALPATSVLPDVSDAVRRAGAGRADREAAAAAADAGACSPVRASGAMIRISLRPTC